jgi:glyoxylase-like metal-dependent hydrolase (beta-lactamase superfamily II)
VRELESLVITKVVVGPHENNVYLLRCRKTGEQLLIDAADEAPRLLALVGSAGLSTVVTTHSHYDHWQALDAVLAATGARSVAPAIDAPEIPSRKDELVEDGDRLKVGDCELEVIQLAGHTPGGIALLYEDQVGHAHLFSADSLFPGGVGDTGHDPVRFNSLLTDVDTKVFNRLPDETWVYPGHGNDTTLGKERPSLPEWRARGW